MWTDTETSGLAQESYEPLGILGSLQRPDIGLLDYIGSVFGAWGSFKPLEPRV